MDKNTKIELLERLERIVRSLCVAVAQGSPRELEAERAALATELAAVRAEDDDVVDVTDAEPVEED